MYRTVRGVIRRLTSMRGGTAIVAESGVAPPASTQCEPSPPPTIAAEMMPPVSDQVQVLVPGSMREFFPTDRQS